MSTFTETDFRLLFKDTEQFDEWLETEFLEVRRVGPAPGVWVDVDRVERMPLLHRSEKDLYLGQHPRHDLSVPVLPFPFHMANFLALVHSDCFKHASPRWPGHADVERMQGINPRTKTLMKELLGHMLPGQPVGDRTPECGPTVPAIEALPISAPAPRASQRLTWQECAGPYILAKLRSENFGSTKELHNALLRDAGADESPFDEGSGSHRHTLIVRSTGRPLRLKTLQNHLPAYLQTHLPAFQTGADAE